LLLLAIGLSRLHRLAWPLSWGWGSIGIALMVYGSIHTGWHKHEHGVKPLVAAMTSKAMVGDPVIVVGGAVTTMKFYEPQLAWPGPVYYCGPNLIEDPGCEFGTTFRKLLRAHGRVWVVDFPYARPDYTNEIDNSAERAGEVTELRATATLW